MEQDIRWKQRFANFSKAFATLKSAVTQNTQLSDLEKEGTIQRFEFTHELAWKVMKDFLEYEGHKNIMGSRTATKIAFNQGIIENGQIWMDMIESRNATVHTYKEDILENEYNKIVNDYYPEFEKFYTKMKSLL